MADFNGNRPWRYLEILKFLIQVRRELNPKVGHPWDAKFNQDEDYRGHRSIARWLISYKKRNRE